MSRDNIIYVYSCGRDLSFYLTSISSPCSSVASIEESLNVDTPIGASSFFDRIKSLSPLSAVKGLVFIYSHPPDYHFPYYNFRERCRIFCQQAGVICHFTFVKTFMAFVGLLMSKVKIFEGETVILASPRGDPVAVWSITLRSGKYCIEDYRTLPWASNINNWRQEIIGFRVPNKIIFMRMSYECNLRKLIAAFRDMNPIIPNHCYVGFVAKAVTELVLQLSGEKPFEYQISPLKQIIFVATKGEAIGKVSNAEELPCTKIFAIPSGEPVFCGIQSIDLQMQEQDRNRRTIDLSQFRNIDVSVLLKVDDDGFFEYEIQPKYLTSSNVKTRLILFENFLSVKFWKNDKKILVNELQKVPYFVNFSKKCPIFGKFAKENSTFVVFDLIKLLSITSVDDIDPTWTFSLSSNNDHQVLVEVETWAGKRHYTPSFIFALLVKWIILQIKMETLNFMDELEVEFHIPEIDQVLKENIIASFHMLKIKLKFV